MSGTRAPVGSRPTSLAIVQKLGAIESARSLALQCSVSGEWFSEAFAFLNFRKLSGSRPLSGARNNTTRGD